MAVTAKEILAKLSNSDQQIADTFERNLDAWLRIKYDGSNLISQDGIRPPKQNRVRQHLAGLYLRAGWILKFHDDARGEAGWITIDPK